LKLYFERRPIQGQNLFQLFKFHCGCCWSCCGLGGSRWPEAT